MADTGGHLSKLSLCFMDGEPISIGTTCPIVRHTSYQDCYDQVTEILRDLGDTNQPAAAELFQKVELIPQDLSQVLDASNYKSFTRITSLTVALPMGFPLRKVSGMHPLTHVPGQVDELTTPAESVDFTLLATLEGPVVPFTIHATPFRDLARGRTQRFPEYCNLIVDGKYPWDADEDGGQEPVEITLEEVSTQSYDHARALYMPDFRLEATHPSAQTLFNAMSKRTRRENPRVARIKLASGWLLFLTRKLRSTARNSDKVTFDGFMCNINKIAPIGGGLKFTFFNTIYEQKLSAAGILDNRCSYELMKQRMLPLVFGLEDTLVHEFSTWEEVRQYSKSLDPQWAVRFDASVASYMVQGGERFMCVREGVRQLLRGLRERYKLFVLTSMGTEYCSAALGLLDWDNTALISNAATTTVSGSTNAKEFVMVFERTPGGDFSYQPGLGLAVDDNPSAWDPEWRAHVVDIRPMSHCDSPDQDLEVLAGVSELLEDVHREYFMHLEDDSQADYVSVDAQLAASRKSMLTQPTPSRELLRSPELRIRPAQPDKSKGVVHLVFDSHTLYEIVGSEQQDALDKIVRQCLAVSVVLPDATLAAVDSARMQATTQGQQAREIRRVCQQLQQARQDAVLLLTLRTAHPNRKEGPECARQGAHELQQDGHTAMALVAKGVSVGPAAVQWADLLKAWEGAPVQDIHALRAALGLQS